MNTSIILKKIKLNLVEDQPYNREDKEYKIYFKNKKEGIFINNTHINSCLKSNPMGDNKILKLKLKQIFNQNNDFKDYQPSELNQKAIDFGYGDFLSYKIYSFINSIVSNKQYIYIKNNKIKIIPINEIKYSDDSDETFDEELADSQKEELKKLDLEIYENNKKGNKEAVKKLTLLKNKLIKKYISTII